ncbi:MAG: sigma-70 family RNA polymerase sigma factor [Isosphaeraceae bacterium]
MVSPQARTLQRDLEVIFNAGGATAQGDGALLERFLTERGQPRETAFEAIVQRHGPMVDRVCRRVLGDGHEAQDAFQAVFLVLARRAGSVRKGDSLASWLHGVALRVAHRARVRLQRTRTREHPSGGLADLEGSGPAASMTLAGTAEVVHQEVERLGSKFRAPIVLCYLEGLTHDEAAARLNWPVGTVRSRLARGRDQLRGRLVRRGLTNAGALAAMAAWLGLDQAAHAAAGVGYRAQPTLSAALAATTARAACEYSAGPSAPATLLSTTALTLTQEVLATMTLQKLATIGLVLLPASLLITAGIVIGREPRGGPVGQDDPAPVAQATAPPAKAAPAPEVDPLIAQLLEAARKRLEAQKTYYEEGRLTLDRMIQASERLMEVERLAAATDAEKRQALRRHVERLKEIENREQAELVVGKGTTADVAESNQSRLAAEVRLKREEQGIAEGSLQLLEAARQRLEAQQKFYEEGRITIDRMIQASEQLMEVERSVASSHAEKREALRRHAVRLKEIENREQAELEEGKSTQADLSESTEARLAAQVRLMQEERTGSDGSLEALTARVRSLEERLKALESGRTPSSGSSATPAR